MAELADAQDLKSCEVYTSCWFDSSYRHWGKTQTSFFDFSELRVKNYSYMAFVGGVSPFSLGYSQMVKPQFQLYKVESK